VKCFIIFVKRPVARFCIQYEKSKAIIEKLLEENARLKERTTYNPDRSSRGKSTEAAKIGIFVKQLFTQLASIRVDTAC
jgi:hypothetical protein